VDSDYEKLIRPIERQMLATVWRVLRSTHDAEDALQEALATIWRRWPRVVRHANPHAVILKICADAAIDRLRRRRRDEAQESISEREDAIPAGDTGPEATAIGRETCAEIMQAVTLLSPHQAAAFVMRFVQEESYERIAAALECSESTARQHIARAKARLEQLLSHLDATAFPGGIPSPCFTNPSS
jgi:RNA polymerase sigma-70 factor, ECF subfamily